LIALTLLQYCRAQSVRQLNSRTLFPQKPIIHLEPEEVYCLCPAHATLKVLKTKMREIRTMHIGHFDVHETIKICPEEQCQKKYRCFNLDQFLAPGSNYGYDVIEHVGYSVWLKSQTVEQIQADFKLNYNLRISESEIAYLAKKFVYYVTEAQREMLPKIKQFLHRGGGYFLYFDAMHPGDGAAHLMCAVAEEISERVQVVLGSVKLPTESTETVAAFLRELKATYGPPLAGVCDLLASNLAAFKEVFPDILLLVCHFHLLRSLGKDFLDCDYTKLQGFLKQYDATHRFKVMFNSCQEKIEANPALSQYLTCNEEKCRESFSQFPRVIQAYYKILWILAYEQDLNGYGYPFDRAEYTYFQRMKTVYDSIKDHAADSDELSELQFFLASFFEDTTFQRQMNVVARKIEDFDRIRTIMRIAPTEGGKGLNDDGEECDMPLMKKELGAFLKSARIANNPDKAYKKLVNQFAKYWKMIFAKPVEMRLPSGEVVRVSPQRTTNLMERLFRDFQRREYKRTGMGTLSRTVRAMVAETPLMKNLECPEFLHIILNGTPTLAARFVQLDQKYIQEDMKRQAQAKDPIPPAVKKVINHPDFRKVFGGPKERRKKIA
jgi:hypothetical protein